ncbi:MAG: DNA-binding protein HU 1 [bacterium]|nr:DNA-binding protein HU 1 [bacterium]NUM67100.1 HU family DNA-binding protein [candidate division KSB1 bacterium]
MASAGPMTKGQLIKHFAEKFEMTRAQSMEWFQELARLAAKEAKKGFTIPDIGKLVVVKRKARMGRNPQTGEAIKIPAKTVLKFRIAKAAKDAALKN